VLPIPPYRNALRPQALSEEIAGISFILTLARPWDADPTNQSVAKKRRHIAVECPEIAKKRRKFAGHSS
jgi:hypothetical protein